MTITVTADMIAAAWDEWKPRNPRRLGPGPGFVEAVQAAIAAAPIRPLVWTQPTWCSPDEYLTGADAAPMEFRYEIDNQGNTARPWRVRRTCDIQPFGWASSLEAAQALAWRDFQERILSVFVNNR